MEPAQNLRNIIITKCVFVGHGQENYFNNKKSKV